MQSAIESLKRLKNLKSKVSSHYFLDRNGNIIQLVKDQDVSWHAGRSKWKKDVNLNNNSIGIEIQNKGHKLGYQNYPKKQIKSLVFLLKKLKKKHQIKQSNILGHSDIAPLRKKDPGEKFPWKILSSKGLCLSYDMNNISKINISRKNKRTLFFKNLYKIGYRYFKINTKSKKDKILIRAFQMKYTPNKTSGTIDEKTLAISHLLASK